jgi:hypothetical protein
VEAATALYEGHNVKDISRSDAGAINLSRTADQIESIIEEAKRAGQKAICFITGVPGSGKTLAGLNIATRRMSHEDEHAVFLSGNGPWLRFFGRRSLRMRSIAHGKRAPAYPRTRLGGRCGRSSRTSTPFVTNA